MRLSGEYSTYLMSWLKVVLFQDFGPQFGLKNHDQIGRKKQIEREREREMP
jgi:hypothetical protein